MTKISEINERELVSIIIEIMELDPILRPSTLVAAGKDDCAVIDLSRSELLVASTDMLHRSTDFPAGMTPWQMGWMSVAVNLSDIAAMGARPIGVMTALGLPPDLELDFVKELVEGMKACVEVYGTHIIGGDIDRHDELTIVGSVLGSTEKAHLTLRKGARIGDLVCVTGELGTAGAVLDALKNDTNVDPGLVKKFYQPIPRIVEGAALARTGCVSSMMDISDGLALSLHDLADASKVGFFIRFESLPINKKIREMARDIDQLAEWSVYNGGDFELLFTFRPDGVEKIGEVAAEFTIIGEVTSDGLTMQRNENIEVIEARGFQQFEG